MDAAPSRPIVVYKLGGSLLDLPDFGRVVRGLLLQRPGCAALLAVGGGAAADVVRTWDRVHRLGEEASHELALEAMSLNESLVQRLLPDVRLVRNRKQFQSIAAADGVGLLCAECFLGWASAQPAAGLPTRLPQTWQVTSDSIAAWVAICLEAAELVLVKSVSLPEECPLFEAVEAGLVDPHFPQLAVKLPAVNWANPRHANQRIKPWLRFGTSDS